MDNAPRPVRSRVRIDYREVGRSRVQASRDRLQSAAWPIAQCAVAAGLAWSTAMALFDHERPYFACVAAVVCLSVRQGARLRRVAELAVGVSVGVLVGELLVNQIGTGAWQIGLVVGIALVLAVALDGGPLVTAQAGLQAVFVVGLPPVPGAELARWEDALLGGAMALVVAALLPSDPWGRARRAAKAAAYGLCDALHGAATAVRTNDPVMAADALVSARATQAALDDWAEQLATGRDIARLSPLRRDRGGEEWTRQRLLAQGVERATRNLRVMVRRILSALDTGDPLPPGLPELLEALADVLDLLAEDLDDTSGYVREAITVYAARLRPDLYEDGSLAAAVVVAQLRAAVVDLLESLGASHDDARKVLPTLH